MDTNSPNRSWDALTARARQAPAPADLDMRHAIRRQIMAQAASVPADTPLGLWEELLMLGSARWLQAGLACLMTAAGWACWQGLSTLNELALFWSVEAPFIARY